MSVQKFLVEVERIGIEENTGKPKKENRSKRLAMILFGFSALIYVLLMIISISCSDPILEEIICLKKMVSLSHSASIHLDQTLYSDISENNFNFKKGSPLDCEIDYANKEIFSAYHERECEVNLSRAFNQLSPYLNSMAGLCTVAAAFFAFKSN